MLDKAQTKIAIISNNLTLNTPTFIWMIGNTSLATEELGKDQRFYNVRSTGPKQACAIVEVTSRNCIYHVCQTGHTMSGAGLLSINESGAVNFLGVHSSPIDDADDCEKNLHLIKNANLNVAITPN